MFDTLIGLVAALIIATIVLILTVVMVVILALKIFWVATERRTRSIKDFQERRNKRKKDFKSGDPGWSDS